MKILVVGSGGREHALCWKINQSKHVQTIYAAPGNGGTAKIATNVNISVSDIPALITFCKEKKIDLVVVGPEIPLVLGLQNSLELENIPCFGPCAFAANLEGSKAFSKILMQEAKIPTAPFAIFDDYEPAVEYVKQEGAPIVVKADGLAAGKGVIVAKTVEEALVALDDIMVKEIFGAGGKRVVIEKVVHGEEASFLAFCDGNNYKLLPSSQDHKPVGDNDTGANTGGMGAYSPAPILPDEKFEEFAKICIEPILQILNKKEQPFKGILYAGLMIDKDTINVLEYNVRFGDPECEPIMMRLETDIVEIMLACINGTLNEIDIVIKKEAACGIIMAANGYPDEYEKGMVITGIEEAEFDPMVEVFQAGTKNDGDKIISTGGRVLCVTALGNTILEAKNRAYNAVKKINFPKSFYRTDIADKGINHTEK